MPIIIVVFSLHYYTRGNENKFINIILLLYIDVGRLLYFHCYDIIIISLSFSITMRIIMISDCNENSVIVLHTNNSYRILNLRGKRERLYLQITWL